MLLLHNLHGLTMRNVAGVAYVAKSWVPNLVAQAGVCCYFMLAQLECKTSGCMPLAADLAHP